MNSDNSFKKSNWIGQQNAWASAPPPLRKLAAKYFRIPQTLEHNLISSPYLPIAKMLEFTLPLQNATVTTLCPTQFFSSEAPDIGDGPGENAATAAPQFSLRLCSAPAECALLDFSRAVRELTGQIANPLSSSNMPRGCNTAGFEVEFFNLCTEIEPKKKTENKIILSPNFGTIFNRVNFPLFNMGPKLLELNHISGISDKAKVVHSDFPMPVAFPTYNKTLFRPVSGRTGVGQDYRLGDLAAATRNSFTNDKLKQTFGIRAI
ncbi:hypothetical protein B0H19DRAFT_1084945 [Mycena capillaripes]|nr:hypothetical protein B0H19DRAFT_1084945 [Mycena capillaripes]